MNPANTTDILLNNISKLLSKLAKDFELRVLSKCHKRGHNKIRRSHTSLFAHLGFESVRLTELADRAGITQQAMGKLVKEMEKSGYVKRHTDDSDKRAKIIELTELGVSLVSDCIDATSEVTAEYILAMGNEGFIELEQTLSKANSVINQTA